MDPGDKANVKHGNALIACSVHVFMYLICFDLVYVLVNQCIEEMERKIIHLFSIGVMLSFFTFT
jgi:hypothetical protein